MAELPKKSLGQHWLYDEKTLTSIVDSGKIVEGDTVLEVGPGLGTLTAKLLEAGAFVNAVEFDEKLAKTLKINTSALLENKQLLDRLVIFNQDILKFDTNSVKGPFKVVANIPYYLTSQLLRVLNESSNPPAMMVLLVQKEVAQRIVAESKRQSILSLTNQFYNNCTLGLEVRAELFTPPPKVDSQVVILNRRERPLFDVDPKKFFRLIKIGFSSPRKTLVNNLSFGLSISKEEIASLLDKLKLNTSIRPERLTLEEWHKLYSSLDIS